MDQILIKPEVEQKTNWYIKWWLFFFPVTTGLTLLLVIIRYPESVAILTTLIMFLIAALITFFWIPSFHKSLLYEINDESITYLKAYSGKIKLQFQYLKLQILS